jgi:hypothetical protein
MIVFRDMTFCLEKKCKKWNTCFRSMTDERYKEQQASGLPFSRFSETPDCFEK